MHAKSLAWRGLAVAEEERDVLQVLKCSMHELVEDAVRKQRWKHCQGMYLLILSW